MPQRTNMAWQSDFDLYSMSFWICSKVTHLRLKVTYLWWIQFSTQKWFCQIGCRTVKDRSLGLTFSSLWFLCKKKLQLVCTQNIWSLGLRQNINNHPHLYCSPGVMVIQNDLISNVLILYPYTAERRDVLGNTSPEAREISWGRSPREISWAEKFDLPAWFI